MKKLFILTIILITIFASCSSDDDFDPNKKYDWEILYHHKYYGAEGYEQYYETEYSIARDTIWNMTRAEVETQINKNYTSEDCTFTYCKSLIYKTVGKEAIKVYGYEETKGEIKRIN